MTRMGNERGVWKLLVGKPDRERPVGRPRMRWENNINHNLRAYVHTYHEPMGLIVPMS